MTTILISTTIEESVGSQLRPKRLVVYKKFGGGGGGSKNGGRIRNYSSAIPVVGIIQQPMAVPVPVQVAYVRPSVPSYVTAPPYVVPSYVTTSLPYGTVSPYVTASPYVQDALDGLINDSTSDPAYDSWLQSTSEDYQTTITQR